MALAPRSTSSFSGASGAGLLLSFGAVSIRPASVRRCILRRPSASPASDCSSSGRRDPGCSCARWGRLISAQIRCAPMWSRKIRAAHALKMPSWFVGCSRSGCKILGRLGRRRWQRRLWLSFSSRRGRRGAVFQPQTSCFVVFRVKTYGRACRIGWRWCLWHHSLLGGAILETRTSASVGVCG